ncbi:Gfo/Idh/MocA family protein [Streptomyces griseoincarnatus]
MTKSLRVGVIGLGWAGNTHARTVRDLEGVELVGVADPDPVRRAAYTDIHAVDTPDKLFDLRLDYCVVAAPTDQHESIGLRAAAAGVHALIEKPLAHSEEAALGLADAFDDACLVGAVGHSERYNPAMRKLSELLQKGEHGRIYHVATSRTGPFPGRIRDVGVVRDMTIHDVDLITWLTGYSIDRVLASTSKVSGGEHEDIATAICRLSGGQIAQVHANWVSPRRERQVTVYTQHGVYVADALAHTVTHYTNDAPREVGKGFAGVAPGPTTTYPTDGPQPFTAEHSVLRDVLLGRPARVAIVSLREGAAAVAAAEAILTAARI